MEINVIIEKDVKGSVKVAWLKKLARAILVTQDVGASTELDLVIVGQERIREVNAKYMDEDEPTDVLSFPMLPDSGTFVTPPDGVKHLGEVVISYPQAKTQAEEHGHTVNKEISLLLIHGVLHLLGYDHDVPQRQNEMRAQEASVFARIEMEIV